MDQIEQHVANYIYEKCKSYRTIEAWLDTFYLWPKQAQSRLNLYAAFNTQQWAQTRIEETDDNCYQKTKVIKKSVSEAFKKTNDFQKKLELTEFFIEEWGGVGRKVKKELKKKNSHLYYNKLVKSRLDMQGKDDTVYFSQNDDGTVVKANRYKLVSSNSNEYGAVSSWSKFLAIAYPEWAHIYDARVAYSLNAIIYLDKLTHTKLWPMPHGVNSRIGLIDIETLIVSSQANERKVRSICKELEGTSKFVAKFREQLYLPKDQTYLMYLSLLEKVSHILNSNQYDLKATPSEIESFLFMVADSHLFDDVLFAAT
ncbi:hypothetical protein [Alteromonas sp. W364]|uniref:hypothetical protein n=1 Tax=Alteromonas sp. W364 TaxID=3075610 RepID=UPI0028864D39|nr:hypothetical protein [Alteromonas sp. W364]MDT0628065.1 hypothetical protein [Alteromonas sp. W364]